MIRRFLWGEKRLYLKRPLRHARLWTGLFLRKRHLRIPLELYCKQWTALVNGEPVPSTFAIFAGDLVPNPRVDGHGFRSCVNHSCGAG